MLKSGSSSVKIWFIFLVFLILFLGIVLSIFITQSYLIAILYFFLIIFYFLFSLFFWHHFLNPNHNLYQVFSHSLRILTISLKPLSRILYVKNGKVNGDYFLLRTKPIISFLLIDPISAVVTQKKDGHKQVYFNGNYWLKPGEIIHHVFDLRPDLFQLGPGLDENPFEKNKRGGKISDFQAKQNRFQQTISITSDGVCIYPSFRIFINHHQSNLDLLLKISAFLENKGIMGEAKEIIKNEIGKEITKYFSSAVSSRILGEITTDFLNHLIEDLNNHFIEPSNTSIVRHRGYTGNSVIDLLKTGFIDKSLSIHIYLCRLWVPE